MLFSIMCSLLFLTACSTGFHGSFIPNTHIAEKDGEKFRRIDRVQGKSCQTRALYVLPYGPPPSTYDAIQSAKGKYKDTKYLTDVSIDDRIEWEFGYSRQCITVEGTAHR
jgi:hypothetical protein